MTDADKNEMRILAQRGRLVFKLLISLSILFLVIIVSVKKGIL